ncbi:MAG: hypothetical protein J6U87_04380 [Clostridia bacterium]|nr:hypothetical protein [Clostridia bacterium]
MRKVKLLSLFLAVLMLCGCVALFAFCGSIDEGILELSKSTVDVDVSDYVVVYGASQSGSNYTPMFRNQMKLFAQRVTDIVGKSVTLSEMKSTRSKAEDKEILIGLTEREESKKALSKIDGNGFIVQVTDNKIVIVGTSNLFTLMGVTYFSEKYLKNAQDKVLTLNEKMLAEELGTIKLADSNEKSIDAMKQTHSYVYQDGIGARPGAYINLSSGVDVEEEEYPLIVVDKFCEKMSAQTGIQKKLFTAMIRTDKETTDKEVLVGLTNRNETKEALSAIGAEEYIITSTEQKVVVTGWSEATLALATAAYSDVLVEATVVNGSNKIVEIPQHFRLMGSSEEEWVTEFPRPEGEGISLYNTMTGSNGALEYLYTGAGVNRAAYDAYCQQLKAAGYTADTESTIQENVFTTFTSKKDGICLYVAFNAFAHKSEYYTKYDYTVSKKVDEKYVGEVYDHFNTCIRIVASTQKNAYLPDAAVLTQSLSYPKKTESKITTIPLNGDDTGLCYIITLEDGRFILFDGGGVLSGGESAEVLWNALRAAYKEVWGKEPTTGHPVTLAAWVLTHGHRDHFGAFEKVANKYGDYGDQGLLKVEYAIANLPAENSVSQWSDVNNKEGAPAALDNILKKFNGCKLIKPHTGMKLYFANAELEVLTTWEDLNPITTDNSNDTCTVVRMSLYNKNASKADPITMLCTGDANRWQSRFLCAMYGDYLKSDMISLAHHGNAGCEIDLYDTVKATVVWWPNNLWAVRDIYLANTSSTAWQYEVDRFVMQLSSTKYVYLSGNTVKNAPTSLKDTGYVTLVLKMNGSKYEPDYENVYDIISGQTLNYVNYDVNNPHVVGICNKKP